MGRDPRLGRHRFTEAYRGGANASYLTESRLPAPSPTEVVRLDYPTGRTVEAAKPSLVVAMLSRAPVRSRFDLVAGRFSGSCRPGEFVVSPPDTTVEFETDAPCECMLLVLPASLARESLAGLAGPALGDHGPLHGAVQRDAVVESLTRRLWAEAAQGDFMGPLFAENVAAAAVARLARLALRAGAGVVGPPDQAYPLSGVRLARVLARIEDGLADDLRQAELSALAGMSPWYFCRAFRAATGVAPHRFVLLRRLARAQRLLRATRLNLVEIAAAGFSGHPHLTRAFKRETGSTPSSWRQAVRG